MAYKLQDSSEEMARISVTDKYGMLPITNELLIALTYEGEESDHVADALAQFEAQAIDLSNSLGGDLTNSFNEQLKQRQTEFQWNEDEDSFIESLDPTLNQLNSEAKLPNYDADKIRTLIELINDALDTYRDHFALDSGNKQLLLEINDNLTLLSQGLDNPNKLGVTRIYNGNITKISKATLHDITENITEDISFLTHAQ
ncbi:hypothetical protein [Weissella minor]|uniref:hypothetical protein n=1 Tax=Weissella minor TaxID=1620 RepID=UPI003AF2E6F4